MKYLIIGMIPAVIWITGLTFVNYYKIPKIYQQGYTDGLQSRIDYERGK